VSEIDEIAADPELPGHHVDRSGTIAHHDDIKVLGSAIKMSGPRGKEIPQHVPERDRVAVSHRALARARNQRHRLVGFGTRYSDDFPSRSTRLPISILR